MKELFTSVPLYFILYVAAVTLAMILFGIVIYPDRLVILLAIPIALTGRLNSFIKAWMPFLLFLFAYEFLRGVVGTADPRVHYWAMPDLDQAVWGVLPTVWLQEHFFDPLRLHWYDYLLTAVYFLHFVAPILFAFLLWFKNKEWFKRFTGAFVLLSYGALMTYLAFPAAPPWLASARGIIPHVTKILDETMKLFPPALNIPSVYNSFNANLVAAVPSLHAAYPTLILLYAVRFFGKKGLLVLPYTLSVWVMVVYFGEHYVSDVTLGIIYAAAAFLAIDWAWPKLLRFLHRQPKIFAAS